MRWQGVYHILTILAGVYDVVTALIDCGDDTFITLRNANDDTDSFDLLSGIPPIHIPYVAILEPGAELTYFEKSNLSKRVFIPKGSSGRDTSGTQGTGSGTHGTGSGSRGTGSTQEGELGPNESSGGKDGSSRTDRKKEDLDFPDGGNQSPSSVSYSSVRSFKTVSSTTTPGAVSTVIASSSVMASANAISTSISTTTAAATSGAKKTRFSLFSVAVACLAMIL